MAPGDNVLVAANEFPGVVYACLVCAGRPALSVVDAIQSLGSVPVDVIAAGVAVLVAGTYKWLWGIPGRGRPLCQRGGVGRGRARPGRVDRIFVTASGN